MTSREGALMPRTNNDKDKNETFWWEAAVSEGVSGAVGP